MRFFVGIIGIPLGLLMVIYRERVKRFTGDFAFAEQWFGQGGTYTALIVVGILITIGSLMYMLGTLQALFATLFGPFFGAA